MAKSDTWMPLYIADYLRDTMHLTRDEHGAYFLLLMACWTRGGHLPSDGRQLAAMAKATPKEWARLAVTILPFFDLDGDEFVHRRVLAEHSKAARLSEVRRQVGEKGGRPTKQIASEQKPIAIANENQNASQSQSQTETPAYVARPSPLPPPTEVSSVEAKSSTAVIDDPSAMAWTLAIKLLTERSGATDKQARSFFGGLLGKHKLEARELLSSVSGAIANETRDPRSYLVKAAEGLAKRRDERTDAAKPKRVSWV